MDNHSNTNIVPEAAPDINETGHANDSILSQVLEYRDTAHAENIKKIKTGIKCIFTVPAFFLILLFLTGSSKIIFLVMWIVSLFIIAAYLIHVEYSDYKIQEMVNSLQDSDKDLDSLIDIDSIYAKVSSPKKKLDNMITNVKTGIQDQVTAVQNKITEAAEAVAAEMESSDNTKPDGNSTESETNGNDSNTDSIDSSAKAGDKGSDNSETDAVKEELP